MTRMSSPTDAIAFTLDGRPRRLPSDTLPTTTLLDWLRGPDARMTGTKEGCAEGDCGACTVALEEPDGARVPINACLVALGQLHGRAIRTVEGLRGPDGAGPHPIQTLMAGGGATQCGFCTPGIVVTAWAHAREGGDPHEALAGNLCRCTGYRPILDAFARLEDDGTAPPSPVEGTGSSATFAAPGQTFHRPTSLKETVALRAARPDAWLLAGGTDLGLRLSEHREHPPEVICLLGVPELDVLEASPGGLRVGAAVSYRRLMAALAAERGFAPFADLLRWLGSRQIRGLGTLGGNLGTASPIGDALPPLLALGATARLAGPGGAERDLPVAAFLTGYRRNALASGEVIRDVWLPRPPDGAVFDCQKLSRRRDQDIAAVGLSVFLLADEEGRVAEARVTHGGLGPTASRAPGAEAALRGARLSRESLDAAAVALEAEIAPMTDLRGSAEYRRVAAGNLLRRVWWRATEVGRAEAAAAAGLAEAA